MKFDPRHTWGLLRPSQRRAVGEAALLLIVSQEAQDIAIDRDPTEVLRRWERAEQLAHRLLAEAIPCDADLYTEGPDFAALGIGACRECGCTDDHACPGGCTWVEPDLCSRCKNLHDGDRAAGADLLDRLAHHDAGIELGPCCMCEGTEGVDNIIMLPRRGAVTGHGWGCVVCHLPMYGAYAVLCNSCLPKWQADNSLLTIACRGYPRTDGRIPIAELPEGKFDHDEAVDHG